MLLFRSRGVGCDYKGGILQLVILARYEAACPPRYPAIDDDLLCLLLYHYIVRKSLTALDLYVCLYLRISPSLFESNPPFNLAIHVFHYSSFAHILFMCIIVINGYNNSKLN